MHPIEPLLPRISETLAHSTRLVIVAPPGAGKTTMVPPALLNASWLAGRKVILLEPRRLAARAAARRMASLRHERVGETVGYRVHLDTVVGPHTRLEVVTEGVLTRMLQSDPTLSDIGAVVFDEFHERSIHADLGLALTLHAQHLVRDDLRIIVMSATLDGDQVARVIDAPLLESEGRAFPVVTQYRPRREREWIEDAVARVTLEAITANDGDVLAFLPGGAEIQRAAAKLREQTDARTSVHPLYGDLPGDAQDAAIAPSAAGSRKIVVATNIAETSLTIEGVRIVVDSGLARAPKFSPRTGLTRLETVRISRASADQRRGRAGRVAPGICYRIWSEGDDAQLAPRSVPEMLEADLAPLAIELAVAGIDDPSTLTWLDVPPAGALAQGRALLERLGALERRDDESYTLTSHGRQIASFPAHPRIAHMLLRSRELGAAHVACDLAALMSGRDFMKGSGADIQLRVDLLQSRGAGRGAHDAMHDAMHRIKAEARMWRERLGVNRPDAGGFAMTGVLLALAYPDRIARRRPGRDGRFIMSNGTGAHFDGADPLADEEWIVIAETDGRVPESRIYLAAAVDLDQLISARAATLAIADDVAWDDAAEKVIAVRRTMLGSIVVKEQPLPDPEPELLRRALVDAIARTGVSALPWSDNAIHLRQRLAFLRRHNGQWPDVSDETLVNTMHEWLEPHLGGARSMRDIARTDLTQALLGQLDWERRQELDALAPTHIELPRGGSARIDYSDPAAPSISVRLQHLYGVRSTPSILRGRVPLTLNLLSPAQRPIQITRDLAAFWRGSYAEVRKVMRGRYPKHSWPEPEDLI